MHLFDKQKKESEETMGVRTKGLRGYCVYLVYLLHSNSSRCLVRFAFCGVWTDGIRQARETNSASQGLGGLGQSGTNLRVPEDVV
jgi:hypothetical protein